ncbi:BTAD domain-containing putative transcriptional regulator [Desulfonatronum parangueonense]
MSRISYTKFIPPDVGKLIVRERLSELLDNASSRPLTWISAPPGSGKTALVAGYVQARKLPLIWYQMDETDIEPNVFFSRLVEAASPLLAGEKTKQDAFGSRHQQHLLSFTDHFFEQFLMRLPANCCLVLDNYQDGMDSEIHKRFLEALAVLPSGCRIFVTTRLHAPMHSIHMIVEQKINFLFWENLRFTLSESKELLGPDVFASEVCKSILDITQGWAAGLVLLGDSLRCGGTIVNAKTRMPTSKVFEYLDVEIFQKLDPKVRDFLIKTSLLRKMTVNMAHALSGSSQTEEILLLLFHNNHFTVRHAAAKPEYEYHPLFAHFLQSIAEKQYGDETLDELRCQAAELLESSGHIDRAVELLQTAGATVRLERLILDHAPQLVSQSRFPTLEKWILGLPENVLDQEPWLLYWLGVCNQVTDPIRSRDLFGRSFEAFRVRRDEKGILSSWCGAVDSYIYDWSDYLSLEEWITSLEILLAEGLTLPATELGARVTSGMVGALVFQRPSRAGDIQRWLELALQHNYRFCSGHVHLPATFHAAFHATWMGDLTKLRIISESIQRVLEASDVQMVHKVKGKSLEALMQSLCFARGDLARDLVEKGLCLSRNNDLTTWNFMLFGQGVFAALTMGDVAAAESYLGQMEYIVPRTKRFARGYYHYLAATFHLFCGNILPADQDAGKALRIVEETGAWFAFPFFGLAKAQTCHESAEFDEREELMERLADFIAHSGSNLQKFMWLLCAAYFALDQGRTEQGLKLLGKGFALGRREGYLNMFLQWRPTMMAMLCATALKNDIEVEYARHLIRRRNLILDPPPLEILNWPWLFRIHMLGRFELLRDGKVVQFVGKVQRRPLDLLKLLAAVGESGAGEEEVCDLLWPDSDGDRAHSSLTTTLSRLRGLLGCNEAIIVSNTRIYLNPHLCWVDTWTFSHLCKCIRQLEERLGMVPKLEGMDGDTLQLFLLAQEALDMYRGHFLPADVAFPWTISFRDCLRSKYFELIATIGDILEHSEDWNAARRCYQQALEMDSLHEDFYARLINCLQNLDRSGEARMIFLRYKERLKTELDMDVTPEFKKMAFELGLTDSRILPQ